MEWETPQRSGKQSFHSKPMFEKNKCFYLCVALVIPAFTINHHRIFIVIFPEKFHSSLGVLPREKKLIETQLKKRDLR
jgi:hypothetical protein